MDSNHHEVVNGLFQRRFKQLEHDTDNILGVLKTFLNVCRTEGQTIALTRKDAEVLVSYITNVRVNHALDRRERDELLETWSALMMTMDAVRPGWNTCHPEVPQSPLQNFVRELHCMMLDAAPRGRL